MNSSINQFFLTQKIRALALFTLMVLVVFVTAGITDFSFTKALYSLPKVIVWIFSNMIPGQAALAKLPNILDKLVDTILMSIMASTVSAVFALVFALLGAGTTRPNKGVAYISRLIASINRNIPVAAWAMILLLTFGQSVFTGFLALFFYSFGFLTRVFMETIEEASAQSVKALTAAGADSLSIIAQSVIPASMPQLVSWILYMIEHNIRSATLVGLLTGSGIGFIFSLYYKSLQYQAAALVVISIVVIVLLIETLSNYLRRVIL
ncbi:ABC transporter permease subunit [Spirochaeta cellobiosiphila]|uniref:ABC transporter permease subunit n=1 Tax=Spirochaeta cellobiosiphila TaxID=504483 RepID=UPI00040936B4|nr:ABC transporter permease subunit [Spirochaeta cellobiosiphila]